MEITIHKFEASDIEDATRIWNQIVEEGNAFPQKDMLQQLEGIEFFQSQSYTGIAVNEKGETVGLYILHPNNVGRCGHICNASYAVDKSVRGQHVGEALVRDCMGKAKEIGFSILQFNAVVATNLAALGLYEKLGFTKLGVIPKGFLMKDGSYEDIIPHIIEL